MGNYYARGTPPHKKPTGSPPCGDALDYEALPPCGDALDYKALPPCGDASLDHEASQHTASFRQ